MRDVTWIQTNDTRGPSSEQQKVENSFGDCPCAFSPPIIFTPLRHGWGLVPKRGELVTKRRGLVPKRLQFHGGLTFVHVIGILTKLFLYQMQRFFFKKQPYQTIQRTVSTICTVTVQDTLESKKYFSTKHKLRVVITSNHLVENHIYTKRQVRPIPRSTHPMGQGALLGSPSHAFW